MKFAILLTLVSTLLLLQCDKSSARSVKRDDPPNEDDLYLDELRQKIADKLITPEDDELQKQAKTLISDYLLALVLNRNTTTTPAPETASISSVETTTVPLTSTSATANSETRTTIVPVLTPTNAPSGSNNVVMSTAVPTVTTKAPSIISALATLRPRPSQEHVLNQVDKILQNVNRLNVTGIVDESLAIRAPAPVRNLVNGILQLVFCNPWDRLWGNCRQMPMTANAN